MSGEQSRARYPDSEGFVERDGMRLFYEVYGEGEETLFLLPTWSLVHSRHWKMQIPYFARHFRVLTMDGLGNGRSDRCRDPRRYGAAEFARDCLAVMDATDTERAVMVSLLARRPVPAGAGAARARALRRRRLHRPDVPLHAVALVIPAQPADPDHLPTPVAGLSLVGPDERRPLAPGLPGVRASGSSRDASRSRTRPRRSRTGSGWALDTDPETLIATAGGQECTATGAPCAGWHRTSTARCW